MDTFKIMKIIGAVITVIATTIESILNEKE